MKLKLLFTKDGLQYQTVKGRRIMEEGDFFLREGDPENYISTSLEQILAKNYKDISIISAINHFTIMPLGFPKHEIGQDLIAYNADADSKSEELMLAVNKSFGIQFYYTLPLGFYRKIKAKNLPTQFNFSGEKFLSQLQPKNGKEIHINLYHHQCEFFAFENKKIKLYNNLDLDSEVDFLYFIMFTLSKIDFRIPETYFHVYGETTENDTFISELNKFVSKLKVVFDNLPKKNFILK